MITEEISISLELLRQKLDRNLVALIQFPDDQETMKALRILEENDRFLGAYNDFCYGIERIDDLELLYAKNIKYKIRDINKKHKSFPSTI